MIKYLMIPEHNLVSAGGGRMSYDDFLPDRKEEEQEGEEEEEVAFRETITIRSSNIYIEPLSHVAGAVRLERVRPAGQCGGGSEGAVLLVVVVLLDDILRRRPFGREGWK